MKKISKEVVKEKLREINKDTVYRIDNTYTKRLVAEDSVKKIMTYKVGKVD